MSVPRRAFVVRSVIALALVGSGCSLFGKLVGGNDQTQANGYAAQPDYAAQQAAELERQDQALQAEIEGLWKEIDEQGITAERAMKAVELDDRAYASGAVARGHVDGDGLSRTTLGFVDDAIAADPAAAPDLLVIKGNLHLLRQRDANAAFEAYRTSFDARPDMRAFASIVALGHDPAYDAAVLERCPTMRPLVTDVDLTDFVEACLQAAGGNRKALAWKGSKGDLGVHDKEMARREEEARRQAEEDARRAEEERLQAEEAARVAAAEAERTAMYTTAAVFAAGDCNFGDCMHDGWEIRTAQGSIRVRCNFGKCLSDGWEASFPDGGTARTSCNFGKCMEDGWETRFPDGTTARTSCNFGKCATDGWETRLPDGSSARTSCNFGDCYKEGWETRLPDGGSVRCSCKFGDCLGNGTECR